MSVVHLGKPIIPILRPAASLFGDLLHQDEISQKFVCYIFGVSFVEPKHFESVFNIVVITSLVSNVLSRLGIRNVEVDSNLSLEI